MNTFGAQDALAVRKRLGRAGCRTDERLFRNRRATDFERSRSDEAASRRRLDRRYITTEVATGAIAIAS